MRDADGNVEVINATDGHPFYVDGLGWTEVQNLIVGEHVIGADGRELEVIANVDDQHPEGVAVYNFTVEDDHTYFVADGQGQTDAFVWVHNNSGCGVPAALSIRGQVVRYDLHQVPAREIQFADIIRVRGKSLQALAAKIKANGFPGHVSYVEINGVKYAVDGNNRLNAALHAGLEHVPARQVTLPFRSYRTDAEVLEWNIKALFGHFENR